MTVSRKGKRPIVVDGQTYLWWVDDKGRDGYWGGMALKIVDEFGEFGVKHPIGLPPDRCHLTVMGRRFRVSGCGGSHRRFRCPVVIQNGVVTPRGVAELIKWSTEAGQDLTEVDWRGQPI